MGASRSRSALGAPARSRRCPQGAGLGSGACAGPRKRRERPGAGAGIGAGIGAGAGAGSGAAAAAGAMLRVLRAGLAPGRPRHIQVPAAGPARACVRGRCPREGREPGAEGMEGGRTAPDGPQQLQGTSSLGHTDGDRETGNVRDGRGGAARGAVRAPR